MPSLEHLKNQFRTPCLKHKSETQQSKTGILQQKHQLSSINREGTLMTRIR